MNRVVTPNSASQLLTAVATNSRAVGVGVPRSPACSADLGIREMECKGPIVDVHELASFEVFGLVDSACADVSDIALVEEDPLSIEDQGARFLAIELERHLSFYDDCHIIAWVKVRRLFGARLPALEHHLDPVRIRWIGGASRKPLWCSWNGDVIAPHFAGR